MPEEINRKINDAAEVAYQAKNRINTHEEVCAIRYKGITESMVGIKKDINTLATRMWLAAGSVIAACLAVILYLIDKV